MKTKTKKTRSTRARPAGPKARIATDAKSRAALAKIPVGSADPPQQWGGVRVYRFGVGKLILKEDQTAKEVFGRWHEARKTVTRAINVYLQAWYHWHWERGSLDEIEKQFAVFHAWENADPKTRGKKPKFTVPSMPGKGDNCLRRAVVSRFPNLTDDTLGGLMQVWRGNLTTGKDTKGRMQKWKAVLLGLENLAASKRDSQIPIAARAFTVTKNHEGKYIVSANTSRIYRDGKKRGENFRDCFELRLPTRSNSVRLFLDRCIIGEYNTRNASLYYHEGKRRWEFLMAYQPPVTVSVAGDPDRVAILRPHTEHPWELVLPEKTIWLGGDGRYVASGRQRIFGQRESRQRNYRYAGSANKGHGRNRALGPIKKLERRWKDLVKTCNHEVTRRAVEIAIEHRCGKIIYEQPTDAGRDELFLATAGRKGIRTKTFWDWCQVGTMLAYKAKNEHLHAIISKMKNELQETI